MAALVPVVGFNAVMTSEHFASFLVSIIAGNLLTMCYCFWKIVLLMLKFYLHTALSLVMTGGFNCTLPFFLLLQEDINLYYL